MADDSDVSNHPDNAYTHSLPKDSPPDGTVVESRMKRGAVIMAPVLAAAAAVAGVAMPAANLYDKYKNK